MDALSHALTAVHMTGAIFYDVECASPWGFAVPPVHEVAHLLAPGTDILVNYHLITDGSAVVRLEGVEELLASAGDVVVLPHGDPHTVSHGHPARMIDSGASLNAALAGHPQRIHLGGSGEQTHIICGFFGCEKHAEDLFLAGLPPVFKVNLRSDPTGSWLEESVRRLLEEALARREGAVALLAKMAEPLFVEILRRYTREAPSGQVGWLAAARDPVVGAALARLHRDPERSWTVAELAAEVAASKSLLKERFTRLLGEPPMAYLTRWRLQLAARRLETTEESVLEIAMKVGYRSESAFNRAFKRRFGLPPARYRRLKGFGRTFGEG